jgi:MYXO-CTERM domain-containing protein
MFGPKGIQVCAPSANNGCTGGTNPTPTSESDDCHGRVQQTLQGMVRIVTNPEAMCTCTPSDTNRMLLQCNAPCTENAMPASATTWHNADNNPYTNAAGGTPVCANAALDPPLISGLAGAVFAPRSGCDVSGQVALVSHSDGLDCPADHPCTLPAGGTAGFVGTPCPGGTCNVDFGFNFTVSDFLVDVDCGLLGFDFCDDLTVTDVTVTGEGTASMALNSAGAGSLGRGDVELATRSFQNGTPFSIQTTNPTATNVVVDWGAKTCMVDQSLPDVTISDGDHSLTFDVIAHMSGPIVNQPPTARAGADQTLECTAFGGSEVKLDGSGSTDPDDNITWYTWRTGSHFDDPILSSSPDPVAETLQPLGTQAYSLRVFDAFSIMSESSTSVKVEDTTPPTIAGLTLTPSCLWPPNHKYVRYRLGDEIATDVSDACDAAPVVRVINVVSSQPDNGRGDGNSRSDILFGPGGFCVRSERSGGDKAGRTYTATISVTDASGNETLRDVELHVPHAGGHDCPALDPSQFLADQDVAGLCTFPEPLVVNRAAPTGAPASGLALGAGCSSAARGTPSALLALGAAIALALRRRRRR